MLATLLVETAALPPVASAEIGRQSRAPFVISWALVNPTLEEVRDGFDQAAIIVSDREGVRRIASPGNRPHRWSPLRVGLIGLPRVGDSGDRSSGVTKGVSRVSVNGRLSLGYEPLQVAVRSRFGIRAAAAEDS